MRRRPSVCAACATTPSAPLPVVVMGRPELTRLYTAALKQASVESDEMDGERAFIAGARKIVELIE